MLPTPQDYELSISKKLRYKVRLAGQDRHCFAEPSTLSCPKLYVVSQGTDIHYVGITKTPMATRLASGLRAKGKGGYYGYKWRKIRTALRLTVWSYSGANGKFVKELEIMEAEFAFLVRQETGKWPLSQTEIHFSQPTPAHLDDVKKILKYIRDVRLDEVSS